MAGIAYVTAETLSSRTCAWLASSHAPPARQRPLPSLQRAALLVLDVQRYFAEPTSHAYLPALAAVLPNIVSLVRSFRDAGRPVVLTRHGSQPREDNPMRRWWRDDLRRGEDRAELLDQLEPDRATLVVDKQHYSAFFETSLRARLDDLGCDTVVIAGVMTHLCCETSAREAFMRGLDVVIAADGCASVTEELHVGALRSLAHGFAAVADTGRIVATLCPGADFVTADLPVDARQVPAACELAIVGAGPAGLAAAIQARRSGLDLILLEGRGAAGGLAHTANLIENYPGFAGGIPGADLVARLAAHATSAGVTPLVDTEVLAIDWVADRFELQIADDPQRPVLRARAVIVATGTAARQLAALGELDRDPRVVDRLDQLDTVRGKRLLLVGGGEASIDQALLARRRGAASASVLIRGERPRALPLLLQRARQADVTLRTGASLQRAAPVTGAGAGPLEVTIAQQQRTWCEQVDAIVVCIGRRPRLPRLPRDVPLDDRGAPKVDALGRSGLRGLYLAGDARRGIYRQVGIAVGDGIAAAMDAARLLRCDGATFIGRRPPAEPTELRQTTSDER